MYLKKSKRANGRIHLSIAESIRENGKVKTRHVQSIGYVDELASPEMPDPVAFWQQEVERRNNAARQQQAPIAVEFNRAARIKRYAQTIDLGEVVLSSYYHHELGLGNYFSEHREFASLPYNPSTILEMLVWNHFIYPVTRKFIWENRLSFPRPCTFSLDDMSHFLDFLSSQIDPLLAHINRSIEACRGKRNLSTMYYEASNLYFELENTESYVDYLDRETYERISRQKAKPRIKMAFLLDANRVPIDFTFYLEGNEKATGTAYIAKAKQRYRCQNIIEIDDPFSTAPTNITATIIEGNQFVSAAYRKMVARGLGCDFEQTPRYISRDRHLRAHFFVCYLSVLVMTLMVLDTKHQYSVRQISKELSRVIGHDLGNDLWFFDYRSSVTDVLAKHAQVDLTRQILTKQQIDALVLDARS